MSISLVGGGFLIYILIGGVITYLIALAIRALKKYIKSGPVHTEKREVVLSLGECLKQERIRCNMTQEFVAETLGVSRQSVSKWENGASSPSTTNLISLAKLYAVSPEDLLKKCSNE